MTVNAHENSNIDEDEAALYDRQIRLWGVEAQNKMKTASVLVVNLRGLAAEVCKNIVLAGIGHLTILDPADVAEEDLGAGYFFREGEVGSKRVTAAQPRIQALNPRVQVTASVDASILSSEQELAKFDLVCLTDSDPATISKVNALCRQVNTKLYAGSSLGFSGYIFADLAEHDYTVQRPDPKAKVEPGVEPPKVMQLRKQSFVPFDVAIQHSWKNAKPVLKPKRLAKMRSLFETLGLLEYQLQHEGALPDAAALQTLLESSLPEKGIKCSIVVDATRLQFLAATASAEFSPSCAVIGGVLGQDILNALGGREAPLINFFVWDGDLNTGDIHALNVQRTT